MSLDIPFNIESEIVLFAQQHHITPDEAVIRLIKTGLALVGSPEDSALLDEVVATAYEERRRMDSHKTVGAAACPAS